IADTGVPSRTRDSVAQVRRGWEATPDRYERLFDEIGAAVDTAQAAIARGDLDALGMLMNRNQRLLQELGVSSPELDRLVDAALRAGALGAKLSGGGKGGCMIALIGAAEAQIVTALLLAGAQRVFSTIVR
ncbi:MAG: mevalonate kinase, partial [Chloroflexi bacterium]|nr:mevalonate kinase [Chloroflexota bacterium]